MRIWMDEKKGEKDHFAARITFCIAGLIAFAIAMPCGFSVMALIYGWPVLEVSLAVCIADVALVLLLARGIGEKVHRYCTIFCQDDEGRLFAVDLRKYVGYSRGAAGYIRMLSQMQKVRKNINTSRILERYMHQRPSLIGVETQIISVINIKMVRSGYRVKCQVEYPNKKKGKRSYLVVNGYENEGELAVAFERRLKGAVM